MNTKTHWRILAGKEYLVGEMLNGKELTLTIKKVEVEELQSERGKEEKPVISFDGTSQKLVVNNTNLKAIADTLQTPYVNEWIGKEITLIPVKGRFFGKEQEAIRVKKDLTKIKPRT